MGVHHVRRLVPRRLLEWEWDCILISMPRGKSRDKMAEQSEDINRDLCVLVRLETPNGSQNRAVKFSGKKH